MLIVCLIWGVRSDPTGCPAHVPRVVQAMAEIVDGQYAEEASGARKAGIPVIGIAPFGVLGARQALQTGGAHYDVNSETKVRDSSPHPTPPTHYDVHSKVEHPTS